MTLPWPPRVGALLQRLCDGYQAALGDNLVGVYLHGSLVLGCFVWEGSDVDYIVVARNPLTLQEKLAAMEVTVAVNQDAPPKGLEMSVVLLAHCREFVYPTPFELHFSPMHAARYEENPKAYCAEMQGSDPDLAAHFTILRHAGIALCGMPLEDVFGPVERAHYFDSIYEDVAGAREDIKDNPVYVLLNLGRVAAYAQEGLVLSKREGGLWAAEHLPAVYRTLLERALACYAAGAAMALGDDQAPALAYCEDVLARLDAHRG